MDDDNSSLSGFGMGLKRFFHKGRTGNAEDVTEEEIKSMVNEGHEHGIFKETEAEMINNIFMLDDKEAHDIMTHRKNIEAVEGSMTLRQFLEFIEDKGHSRYPVYQENIDNIIGVIHIRDVLNLMLKQDMLDVPLEKIPDLIRPVAFIPETRSIDTLFRSMQSRKMHMVIVVDEYGQTSGLVSMEDILEEIVGNILDEHDQEETSILCQPDGSWLMDGMADMADVCERLGIEDKEIASDFDTLNGYLVSRIDRIPSDGETFCVSDFGYRFDILAVENKMIRSVRVTKETPREAGQPESE